MWNTLWTFLWDKPEVSLLLSGMTEPEQVEANLEYASRSHVGMVTEEEKAVYEKAKKIFDEMALVNCTKCAYWHAVSLWPEYSGAVCCI